MSFTTTTTTKEDESQSLFVTVAAGALSSVGYGVSVFATGIHWLLPSVRPALPAQVKPKPKKHDRSRRRSAPPALQSSVRRPTLSPVLIPATSPDSPRTSSTRHVSFLDSPPPLKPPSIGQRRYSVPPEDLHNDIEPDTVPVPLEASPRSSSSTLVHTAPSSSPRTPSAYLDPESTGSESSRPSSSASNPPSLSMTPRLPSRLKNRWTRKSPSGNPGTESGGEVAHSDQSHAAQRPSTPKERRRTSIGLSWPISMTRASNEMTCSSTPPSPRPSLSVQLPDTPTKTHSQDCPSTPTVISSFVRSAKVQRRVSAPTRQRTQPYAYPYFAAPPLSAADVLKVDSGSSTQSLESNEMTAGSSEEGADVGDRRLQNSMAQASLGLGRRPPPHRTVSEGFALAS